MLCAGRWALGVLFSGGSRGILWRVFGAPGPPQICPAPPANYKKTPRDQGTREKEGSGNDTKTTERYEYVAFSLFSVLCSSGRHFERPGVPQGPILDALGTSNIVFLL